MFSNNEEGEDEMENPRAGPIDMEQSSEVGLKEQGLNTKGNSEETEAIEKTVKDH